MIKETAIEDVLAETVLMEKDYDENSINAESEDVPKNGLKGPLIKRVSPLFDLMTGST